MGKGSKRRPIDNRHCSNEEFSRRWDNIFSKEEEIPKEERCWKCGGDGWVWGDELDDYERPEGMLTDDTRYTCDICGGDGRIKDECE